MIVTSKRCWLNVLTQLYSKDDLINANYYMADTGISNCSITTDQIDIDRNGNMLLPVVYSSNGMGKYNIYYDDKKSLDPFEYAFDDNGVLVPTCSRDLITKKIYNKNVIYNVWHFLFDPKNPPKGNGLQILIYFDDCRIQKFGDIICNYLSSVFGVDISFIDAQFVSNCCTQQYFYPKNPNKDYVNQIIEAAIYEHEKLSLMTLLASHSINNIESILNTKNTPEQILKSYNIIFPSDPLPPGIYTVDRIRKLILSRLTGELQDTEYNNIQISNDIFDRYFKENNDIFYEDDYEY